MGRSVMKVSKVIRTQHDVDSLRIILADPQFTIPRMFPTLKDLKVVNRSFHGKAKYLFFNHEVKGNVYVSSTEINYPFTLSHDSDIGVGKLTFYLRQGELMVTLEYEGWMEDLSRGLLKKWLDSFTEGLEEELRMERIRRKI